MAKPKQLDLEEAISKAPQRELIDAFTGVVFQPKVRNHYEEPDPVPFAPQVNVARPTVRQRIENLISRGVDPLHDYVRRSMEPDEDVFDVPDDPEAPLTASEANYLDSIASEIAEAAPLPDDGLPRQVPAPQQTEAEGGGEPEGGVHSDSAPPSEEPPAGRQKPPSKKPVPTR